MVMNRLNHHPHFYGAYEKLFKRITEIAHTAPGAAGGQAYYCNDDAMSDYFDLAYYVNISLVSGTNP